MSSRGAFLPPQRRRWSGKAALWSTEDLRLLRSLAASGVSVSMISTTLSRTESSIRNKALMHGISLQVQRVTAVKND